MLELLDLYRPPGERLDAVSYVADFEARFWRIGDEGLWKLECLQNYQEHGFASWEAFRAGDWDGSLRLVEELRPGFEEYYGRISANGFRLHRTRVVQEPITPYVQWEMQILRAREQCGEAVTVLTADRAAALTGPAPLPDLVTLGAEAAYEIHYTEDGTPDGATRHTDRGTVRGMRAFIQQLHGSGQQLASYFAQRIADLTPPQL